MLCVECRFNRSESSSCDFTSHSREQTSRKSAALHIGNCLAYCTKNTNRAHAREQIPEPKHDRFWGQISMRRGTLKRITIQRLCLESSPLTNVHTKEGFSTRVESRVRHWHDQVTCYFGQCQGVSTILTRSTDMTRRLPVLNSWAIHRNYLFR